MPRFPYLIRRRSSASVPLGGAISQARPLIPLTLLGSGSDLTTGLVDTGADETVFPLRFAALAGIDLGGARSGTGHGPDGSLIALFWADVRLRIAGPGEFRDWPSCVAFSPTLPYHALLGHAGFLQYFTATFRGDDQTIDLAVNPTYPGT